MKKFVFLFLISILACQESFTQNDIQLSNFMFNKMSFNPAFAGNTTTIDASILARQQWMGFKNSPVTQFLNFNTFVNKIGGVGLSVVNDKLGYEKATDVKLSYCYPMRIKMRDKAVMSAGVSVGFLNKTLDGTKLIFDDSNEDPEFTNYSNKSKINFDFGIMYTNQKLTAGISSTHINQSNKNSTIFNVPRHIYLFSSYKYEVNDIFDIVPSLFIKSTAYITQYEINTNFVYNDELWGGASYRLNESIVFLCGITINRHIKMAYSFDYNIGTIKSYSGGSHEIMLIATFYKHKRAANYFKSPRYIN